MARLAAAIAVAIMATLLSSPAHATESNSPRRVMGHARGVDAGARDRAIQMAMREAVLEVVQERIPSPRITPFEDLLDRAAEFVAEMRVVDFETTDGISTIELALRLHEQVLLNAIADAWLQDAALLPTVAALTAMRQEGAEYRVIEGHPAQSALEAALAQAGLEVTGLESIMEYSSHDELAAIVAQAGQQAPHLARAHLCDAAVILLATVDAEPVPGAANVFAVTAAAEMFVGSTQKGVPTHTEHTEALVHGADPDEAADAAIQSAVMRLARKAFPLVILASAASEAREHDIVVTVDGPLDDDALESLLNAMAKVPGVEEVETLFHARRGSRLRIRFPGEPGAFIDPALQALPPTLPIEVSRIIDREMRLHVRDGAQ